MHRSSSSQHAHAPLYPLCLVCSANPPVTALKQRRLLQLRHELIDVLDLYESVDDVVSLQLLPASQCGVDRRVD